VTQSPPDPTDQTDRLRIKIGCTIIIAAMLLVLGTLLAVIHGMAPPDHSKVADAKDVVAVVGAVTTFLGTAIGLFFGVSVGQTGKTQAEATARTANATAAQATATAAQATSAAATAQQVSHQAMALAQLPQQLSQQMSLGTPRSLSLAALARPQIAERVQLMSNIRALHALVPLEQKPAAAAPFAAALAAARPDAADIEQIVFNIVTGLVAQIVGVAAAALDVTRTFVDADPNGYGMAPGNYASLCDQATQSINDQCNAAITLNAIWRDQHATKPISTFCSDAAHLAAGSPAT
jgi:hypothetical protein